jgi:hypothetical protein
MAVIRIPDINLAVSNFLRHFESLSRLPLVTNAEMDSLFGEEVAAALQELGLYGRQEGLCRTCRSRCCLLVDCELYEAGFSRCSIHDFRPVLCRMHFCNKFAPVYRELVKTVGDIFLESLLAGEHLDPAKTKMLDSPPLRNLAPDLVDRIGRLIKAFDEGFLDEPAALKSITAEIEKQSDSY